MTFGYIAFKNFMVNGKRYLSFFICSSFSIMVLFMLSTLKYNRSISHEIEVMTSELISASVIAIIVFAFFFLNYAYSSFIKSRNKELGLFMALGMNMKEINRLLFVENIIIIGMSLLTGLLLGTVFSRLFFMVILDILNINGMNYEFQLAGYFFTSITFLIIFLSMIIYGYYTLRKVEITELLKYDKKSEKRLIHNPFFGIMGIVIIIIAYVIKYCDAVQIYQVREVSTKFTILCLTGLYFFITQFCDLIIKLFEKVKLIYIKNLLSIKEMRHKFDRNKAVLYIMTMLSAFTMFFLVYSYSSGLTYFGSNQKEANLLLFISSFLAVLFFISSVCIIYFKLFTEIEEERLRYKKLLNIGITQREVYKYISLELKVLFFVPTVLSLLIIYPYTYIDNIKSNALSEILFNFLIIQVVYFVFQIAFYWAIKLKYTKEITESE